MYAPRLRPVRGTKCTIIRGFVHQKTQKRLNTRSLFLVLHKKEKKEEFWTRLTEERKLPFVKTDFEKWVDEDEQNGAPVEDDFDMDDMAGMGGLPGMGGGLGGMGGGLGGLGGGLGGMGGGGMDFEKVSIIAECWRC